MAFTPTVLWLEAQEDLLLLPLLEHHLSALEAPVVFLYDEDGIITLSFLSDLRSLLQASVLLELLHV
jgi:hypothetical protein